MNGLVLVNNFILENKFDMKKKEDKYSKVTLTRKAIINFIAMLVDMESFMVYWAAFGYFFVIAIKEK